ncbi:MAG: hypothetical protein ACRD7E_28320 [Bryobacteraceae bacterium]
MSDWVAGEAPQDSGDGALGDRDTEHLEFAGIATGCGGGFDLLCTGTPGCFSGPKT